MEKLRTYLALGDSYTIGEAVSLPHSFPYQTVQILRSEGWAMAAPEIIAKTGWTTDELSDALQGYVFSRHYDLVTLLIGVNNQYRGRSVETYAPECEALLVRAIELAQGSAERVFVLSIPDYGVTPFAREKELNAVRIAAEIDQYNAVARALAAQYKCHFVDITPGTREAATDSALLASDGLHPSETDYRRWALMLAAGIRKQLS